MRDFKKVESAKIFNFVFSFSKVVFESFEDLDEVRCQIFKK